MVVVRLEVLEVAFAFVNVVIFIVLLVVLVCVFVLTRVGCYSGTCGTDGDMNNTGDIGCNGRIFSR